MIGINSSQYKVDEDEEVHNPLEPSTTICPLLPGQRLNVLEMPMEKHSRSNSETSGAFTRNPSDRYLTPVPPAPLRPLPSPRLGVKSSEPYSFPVPSPRTPRSATYPSSEGFLSPNVIRHVRSASTSPRLPATPIFADFKGLKEKLASKRSASKTRNSSKCGELEISSPVLVSTTNGDVPLIPLPGSQVRLGAAFAAAARATGPGPRSIPIIRREFSPLGSHPVDPSGQSPFSGTYNSEADVPKITRRRSHVPSTVVTSEFRIDQGRIRANSTDTRRTQHYLFSNDPWMSSPKWPQEFDDEKQVVEDDTPAAPTLNRPALLDAPSMSERPTSSHGNDCNASLRQLPLDKALPNLPKFMAPPPLHERKPYIEYEDLAAEPQSPASEITDYYFSEIDPVEGNDQFEDTQNTDPDLINNKTDSPCQEKLRSHFSTWSNGSLISNDSVTEDDIVHSPTFTSLTPSSSEPSSPKHLSLHLTYAELPGDAEETSTVMGESEDAEDDPISEDDDFFTPFLSPTPPQLDDLRISKFGSDLFNFDIKDRDSGSHRQATCFGLGFQYSLPEDEMSSGTNIKTDTGLRVDLRPNVQRESSMSQLNTLMTEFAFLGDSVL